MPSEPYVGGSVGSARVAPPTWRQNGVGISSTARGLSKMNVNPVALDKDLEAQWPVVSEAIQTILRREGYPKPYEALKELTRGQAHITEASIKTFVQGARGDCCATH